MMNHAKKRGVLGLALAAMVIADPAAAATACWSQTVTEAAQVKQFDIMLMVSALRCHGQGMDFTGEYNRFVIAKRTVLRGVGDEIVRQFNAALGGKAALNAYDRFGVVMANKFGNGVEGTDCEGVRLILADANTVESSRDNLVALAQRAGMEPPLPAPRCGAPAGTVIAVAAPVETAPAVALTPVAVAVAAPIAAAPAAAAPLAAPAQLVVAAPMVAAPAGQPAPTTVAFAATTVAPAGPVDVSQVVSVQPAIASDTSSH